jgi:hypothetical protein
LLFEIYFYRISQSQRKEVEHLRKSLLVLMAVVSTAGSAMAAFGDLMASFPNQPASGTASHYGLAADANYLYSYYYTTGYQCYVMLRSNGSLVSSYECPLGTTSPNYYWRGVENDGTGNLNWINYSLTIVARARASDGSLVSSWTYGTGTRYAVCSNHTGTSAGTYFYTNYYTGDFWTHNSSGSEISSWSLPFYTYNYDLEWDWNNKLMWAANYSTDWIYGIDPVKEEMVRSFRHPEQASISSCYGIAYWPPYIYVSNSGGTPDEYIWVFHCPNNVSITPASIGKVKALYR